MRKAKTNAVAKFLYGCSLKVSIYAKIISILENTQFLKGREKDIPGDQQSEH